jgi:dTDP-4-amino-4,6-dideoxygalactose transaminase
MPIKNSIDELALFGGKKLFAKPVSTSNLVRPDLKAFLQLLKPALNPDGEAALINQLEQELCDFHQCAEVVTFCSGFWALVLAIKALALPGKTEVIMPSLTYRRLADVVAWTGLIPRFCEVDQQTLAISATTAAPHVNDNTALIIGVHPIVNCCDAPSLEQLARQCQIPILFDGVESVYEFVAGKKTGGFGQAECFSFHASKLINGFEGGYVTTNDHTTAQLLRVLSQGQRGGIQAQMPAVHAAMALQSLREIETQIQHNREVYQRYQSRLTDFRPLELLRFKEDQPTSYKNIVIKLTDAWPINRDLTIALLNAEGILSRAYYYPALHNKKVEYPTIVQNLPFTDQASTQYMLMPCGYQVTVNDVDLILDFMIWLSHHHQEITTQHGAST